MGGVRGRGYKEVGVRLGKQAFHSIKTLPPSDLGKYMVKTKKKFSSTTILFIY
jgi:hypothetical protein